MNCGEDKEAEDIFDAHGVCVTADTPKQENEGMFSKDGTKKRKKWNSNGCRTDKRKNWTAMKFSAFSINPFKSCLHLSLLANIFKKQLFH